jgi:hypothetical protein
MKGRIYKTVKDEGMDGTERYSQCYLCILLPRDFGLILEENEGKYIRLFSLQPLEIPAETHTCCYAPLPSHRWMQTQTYAVVLDHFR